MKAFEEVNVEELNAACKAANACGLMKPKIKYNKIDGETAYTNFIKAIEKLEPNDQKDLPNIVVEFYNSIFLDEFPEEELEKAGLVYDEAVPVYENINSIQDFAPGIIDSVTQSATESETKEEETIEYEEDLNGLEELDFVENAMDAFQEEEETEDELVESIPDVGNHSEEDVLTVTEFKDEELDDKPELKSDDLPKRKVYSKIPMSLSIEDGLLNISFKSIPISKSFTLPEHNDKQGLKVVRKAAFAFTKEIGATKGQQQAVSKELNLAGYYMR